MNNIAASTNSIEIRGKNKESKVNKAIVTPKRRKRK